MQAKGRAACLRRPRHRLKIHSNRPLSRHNILGRNAEHRLKDTRLVASMAGVTTALCLFGCVTTGQTHVNVRSTTPPQRAAAVVTVPSAPHTVVAVRPVFVEEVVPETNDMYISAAANADVVFVDGSTYIWAKGPDGQRHRHFYGHGDRRHEVFARRENLRSVIVHRPGRPPANYASHDSGRHREDTRHRQLARSAQTHGPGHQPRDRLTANNPQHRIDPHHQPGSKQSQSLREASVGHNGLRHRPESGT